MASPKLPALFLNHGGGPSFFMKDSMIPEIGPFVCCSLLSLLSIRCSDSRLAVFLRSLPAIVGKPRAILLVSAHWESDADVLVNTQAAPSLLFDYYGFPPETYSLKYPAPGSPAIASQVVELLRGAGIAAEAERSRGWDHGVFVPLKVAFPDGDVPVVQVSLLASLDPAAHVRIGRALAPLRSDGVLIVGSGAATHNLREVFSPTGNTKWASEFTLWLDAAITQPAGPQRTDTLVAWRKAPGARTAHPREEHLVPLFVALGAAEEGRGSILFEQMANKVFSLNCYRFD